MGWENTPATFFYRWEHEVLVRIHTTSENAPDAVPIFRVTTAGSPVSDTDSSQTLTCAAVFMDYSIVIEVNCH